MMLTQSTRRKGIDKKEPYDLTRVLNTKISACAIWNEKTSEQRTDSQSSTKHGNGQKATMIECSKEMMILQQQSRCESRCDLYP